MSPTPRTLQARHLQMARAAVAFIAAMMITFVADHSAREGLSVFSGFAILTALILFLAAWLVRPALPKTQTVLLAVPMLVAGMIGGIDPLRSTPMFFALVIAWAFVVGIIEFIVGLRARHVATTDQQRSDARDAVLIGAAGVLLGIALLVVPSHYVLHYFVPEAHRSFTLTGITIGVGIFGFYAAVVAVFLGIASFSPRKDAPATSPDPVAAETVASDNSEGVA